MRTRKFRLLVYLFTLILLVSCNNNEESKILISSAVSMKSALEEIAETYEKKHPDVAVQFNFGASGALATQISQGAPVDIFISAAVEPFDKLAEAGKVDSAFSSELAGNSLVLIQKQDGESKINSFEELGKGNIAKIALGTPETVPAGKYAKETLEKLNLWEKLASKAVYTKDVSQVVSYVETGNVDAGIVYLTDALKSEKIVVRAEADATLHSPIVYPAGVLKGSANASEAERFFEFLTSKEAAGILKRHGFAPL